MTEHDAKQQYLAAFSQVEDALPGAEVAWLRDARRTALERFAATGLPTRRQEEWKYTGVTAIEGDIDGPATDRGSVSAKELAPHLLEGTDNHRLVFVDGRLAPPLSTLSDLPAGAQVSALSALVASDPERVRPYLSGDDEARWFEALNGAFVTDGAVLIVEPGAVLEQPLHVLYVATATSTARAIHPRNVIVAGPNSQATVIEHFVGIGDQRYLTNSRTEVHAGMGAVVHHCKVQQEGAGGYHVGMLRVCQAGGSRVLSDNFAIGGRLVRNDIDARLEGEGAYCTLHGLFVGGGRQHIDNHTSVEHLVPGCFSREHYKGILDGHARGIFNGRVKVHPDAQKTDAQQANNNLLLSRDAEIDTKPQLEIYADDVKCSHGATVGELEDNAVFYLRSRGIDEAVARSLLTYAFAEDLLRHIEPPALRRKIEEIVISKLADGQRVRELL